MSSRGVILVGAELFLRRTRRALSTSATAASTLVGAGGDGDVGDSDNSVSSIIRVLSSRATAETFSARPLSRFSPAARAGVAAAGVDCKREAAFDGNGIRLGSLGRSAATAASAASPGRAARGIGRSARACSIRCRTRNAKPRPTSRSPPTAATTPGVTIDASKTRSWSDTPEAASTIPAAVKIAPNTNKSKYIRPSPAPARRPRAALRRYCDGASGAVKGYSPLGARRMIERCDMVNGTGVAQPPAKVLFRGTILFLRRLHCTHPPFRSH